MAYSYLPFELVFYLSVWPGAVFQFFQIVHGATMAMGQN